MVGVFVPVGFSRKADLITFHASEESLIWNRTVPDAIRISFTTPTSFPIPKTGFEDVFLLSEIRFIGHKTIGLDTSEVRKPSKTTTLLSDAFLGSTIF